MLLHSMAEEHSTRSGLRAAFVAAAGGEKKEASIQAPGIAGLCVLFSGFSPTVEPQTLENLFSAHAWPAERSFTWSEFLELATLTGVAGDEENQDEDTLESTKTCSRRSAC